MTSSDTFENTIAGVPKIATQKQKIQDHAPNWIIDFLI